MRCPYCGLETVGFGHSSERECTDALAREIDRVRSVLRDRVVWLDRRPAGREPARPSEQAERAARKT